MGAIGRLRYGAALVLACTATAAVAASGRVALDGFFTFDNAYRCTPGPAFGRLLRTLVRWDEVTDGSPGGETYRPRLMPLQVPGRYRGQFGAPRLFRAGDEYRVTIPVRGTWRGLPLRSLVLVNWPESEGGFELVFDAPPDDLRRAANAAGFRIPAAGRAYRDSGVMGVTVGIGPSGKGSALSCYEG